MQVYSLTELNLHIRQTLEDAYPEAIWISAEIVSLTRNGFSGHCYLELTDGEGQPARARAMIWKKTFEILQPKFELSTGTPLQKGLKVQMLVKVEFNVQYGLSLIVWDLDAEFTLGDLAGKRAKVLRRLAEQGLEDKNKSLTLAKPTQRLAVISSPSAAGYQDFETHLIRNPHGYAFQITLFPAQMQGLDAVDSLVLAFQKIALQPSDFDAVALIRGGGSSTDLLVFDELEVAKSLANCPLPVFTGIGHERDESVCDRIAHTRFKTPTAVADGLLDQMRNLDAEAVETEQAICQQISWKMNDWIAVLQLTHQRLYQKFSIATEISKRQTRQVIQKLLQQNQECLYAEKEKLAAVESLVYQANPLQILEKGYARVWQNGKRIHRKSELAGENEIDIQWIDGKQKSIISKP